MLKNLITLALVLCTATSNAQSTAGLVAHWDMNGTTNDVSGNGHNRHPNFITSAAGKDGLANTAYHFNGTNSAISIPYSPAFNFTKYSICAIVRSEAFHTGPCFGNTIISRGREYHTGNWAMYFDQSPNDCVALDTTQEVFFCTGGANTASSSGAIYSPTVVNYKWYKVVITYDSLAWRVYVDDTLKVTGPVTSAITPIGVSTDSVSIGMDITDAAYGYPYNFTGNIDDIMLYNRVLDDSEILHYGDTCGYVTIQPSPATIVPGGNTTFAVSSSILYASYQWQQDAGTGFVNLTNAGVYSGVTTPTLTITSASTSINGALYRCLVSNSWVCSDTSSAVALAVHPLGTANVFTKDMVTIYPNPAGNSVSVHFGNSYYQGSIQLINEVGQILSEQKIGGSNSIFDLSHLPAAMYIIKIQIDGQVFYKRLLKN